MSQASYYQEQKRIQQEEEAFRAKYQDPVSGRLRNVPVQGGFSDAENKLVERLQYAIEADPRTKLNEDSAEEVHYRRKAVHQQEAQEEESKRVGSTQVNEAKLFNHLESMNLEPQYRTYIPDWAIRDED